MSLKKRVSFIILGAFLVLGGVQFSIQRFIILPGFLSLEREEAIEDVLRIEKALNREIGHIESVAKGWATWDDTWSFVQSHDEDYERANLIDGTLRGLGIDLLYICDIRGGVVRGKLLDPESGKEIRIADFPAERFPEGHPLVFRHLEKMLGKDPGLSGILSTSVGPLLVSSQPILKSSNEGPVRGSLMMGCFIDSGFVQKLSQLTRIDIEIIPFTESDAQLDAFGYKVRDAAGRTFWMDQSAQMKKLNVAALYKDIDGSPVMVLKAEIQRKIMERGYEAVIFALASFLVSLVTALTVMLILMQRGVLKPITKLTGQISDPEESFSGSQDIPLRRNDEIGILSREFEKMLTQLHNRSRRLEELNEALMEDVDQRKRAEAALRESEERFKTLLENLPVGVYVHGIDEKILLVNDVACENTGYSREELLSMSLGDINPNTIKAEEQRRLWDKLGEGNSIVVETVNIRKDGSKFPVEVHLTRIDLEGKPIILALSFDITERKKAAKALKESEEKLVRSKKMESLGLLAGGVAHDLNNVLSGIVSYPELILMDLPKDSKLFGPIKTMHTSGTRAVAIVQDLLTVARGVAVEKQPMGLNEIATRYLESAEHDKLLKYHDSVVVKTDLDPKIMNIKGASVHVGKALMNLVSNAVEAIEEDGEVVIKTQNRYLDRPLRGYEEVNIGEYAVLTVSDNGPGINQRDLERIFEPFYTKKVMGRSGTGLGLAIVWNVMQEHNGYIDVISDGSGTAFDLYFPITREKLEKKDIRLSIKDYTGRGEKILVVDDVESQREIFCNMLKILGYQAKAVDGGAAAVEYLKKNSVDIVLLDMIMDPGMSGRETYDRILKIHPGQKAIIVSGFAETQDVKTTQRLGAGRYLKKPVQIEKLGLAIKAELEGSDA